jgi:3-hydroxyacyl-[acyl-carrier-protein] dehydratase
MPILDVNDIRRILPHRYPFLLVDRIVELEAERIVGIKNVTVNEPFFNGHFPDFPVMPGVLIVEAMAQTAGALAMQTLGLGAKSELVYFMTIDRARFRRPVRPGDVLRMPVKVLRRRGPVWRFEGQAFVGERLCADAEFSAMIADRAMSSNDHPSNSNR